MTPPRTIIGTLANAPIVRKPFWRRVVLAILMVILAVLTYFPQQYRAATSLTPTEPSSLGLSGALGQLGAVNSVFGNQAAVEIALRIARSEYVRSAVSKQIGLQQRLHKSDIETHRWLDRKMDVRSLKGGIIQIAIKERDPVLAAEIITAYSQAVRSELARIGRNQTAYKRKILLELVDSASRKLQAAQIAYDSFRLQTRYSSPQSALFSAGDRIPEMEAMIRAKKVQLAQMRQFATDDNMRIRQVVAEIEALQGQLEAARSLRPDEHSSVGQVVRQSTEVNRLRRDLDLAQLLYDNYKRYLQGTSVEDLTQEANVRVLEPAYVDTARQLNVLPLGLLIVLFIAGVAVEFYAMRPPVLERGLA